MLCVSLIETANRERGLLCVPSWFLYGRKFGVIDGEVGAEYGTFGLDCFCSLKLLFFGYDESLCL